MHYWPHGSGMTLWMNLPVIQYITIQPCESVDWTRSLVPNTHSMVALRSPGQLSDFPFLSRNWPTAHQKLAHACFDASFYNYPPHCPYLKVCSLRKYLLLLTQCHCKCSSHLWATFKVVLRWAHRSTITLNPCCDAPPFVFLLFLLKKSYLTTS